jgi:hypothetical protein
MESASSRSVSGAKSLRGCSDPGRMRPSGTRCTCSRVSSAGMEAGVVIAPGARIGCGGLPTVGVPPRRAPRPRPKAGFAMPPECRKGRGDVNVKHDGSKQRFGFSMAGLRLNLFV